MNDSFLFIAFIAILFMLTIIATNTADRETNVRNCTCVEETADDSTLYPFPTE